MRIKVVNNIPIAKAEWYRWFAWYPILVSDSIVWFEYVDRRDGIKKGTLQLNPNVTEYRLLQKGDKGQ